MKVQNEYLTSNILSSMKIDTPSKAATGNETFQLIYVTASTI